MTERVDREAAAVRTLDRRTKRYSSVRPITIEEFVDQIGPRVSERNGELATRAQLALEAPPLVLSMDGASCTLDAGTVRHGNADGALGFDLDPKHLGELVAGVRTPTGLVFAEGVQPKSRGLAEVCAWDHVLRALLDGEPLHEPGDVTFGFDLGRSFTPEDSDDDIASFLTECGFLHLRGWVDPALLPQVDGEVDAAARRASRDEPHRWWARLADGTERCVRVMNLLDVSATMAGLLEDPAYRRLGSLLDDGHRRSPDHPQACEALIKPVDVVEGLSEFPWHRDCSQGGHDYGCAAYAVGLPLTRTDRDAGHLQVVAGSHRVNTPGPGAVPSYEVDLPVVPVLTEPGDLTVHVGCTLHRTRRPRTAERTVVYTTFSLGPLASG